MSKGRNSLTYTSHNSLAQTCSETNIQSYVVCVKVRLDPLCSTEEEAAIANPNPPVFPSQRFMPRAVVFYEVIGQTAVKNQEK
jgi:hypothetical protein